jgi:hypothetical protein
VDPVSEALASVELGRFRILPHRREVAGGARRFGGTADGIERDRILVTSETVGVG